MLNVALARKRREELGLSQRQLADQLGIWQGSFANWELGNREPRSDQLVAWARALGLQPGELLAEPAPAGEVPAR